MDCVRLAGLPDCRYGEPAANGRGTDLCPPLRPVHAGWDRRRGRSRCARSVPPRRFAPAGSTIEISTQSTLAGSVVAVRDHGPGVPEFDLERIFEAFYRVAPARDSDSGGVGLGLAIAARIMALHGGGTKARNATDGGLIVELRFPFANASADDHMAAAMA